MMWLEKPEYKYRIKEFAGRYTIEVAGEVTVVTGWWWSRVETKKIEWRRCDINGNPMRYGRHILMPIIGSFERYDDAETAMRSFINGPKYHYIKPMGEL